MENPDTIAYKTWVENLQEPAPEGAWNAVADQLDIDAAWDNISETLDLDAVWQNIDAALPSSVTISTPKQTHLSKLFWVAAALILITLTTPISETTSESKSESVVESAEVDVMMRDNGSATNVDPSTTHATDTEKSVIKIDRNRSERNNVNSFDQNGSTSNSPITSSEVISNESNAETSTQPSIKVIADVIPEGNNEANQVQPADTIALPVKNDSLLTKIVKAEIAEDTVQKTQPERAKWQVGIIGSIKNTWLINPETTNGLMRSSLNDTRLTFGKEFGITLQRSVGGASAVQLEYYFYSEIGQRYHEYINALYQTKDVKLQYQKFQIVYRTRIWRNLNSPALYAVGGIRVSRLTLANTSIGDENEIVTHQYRPWDYGFIVGGEAEFMLTNKLIMVSGLRLSYGLRNIYLGNGQAQAEFNKTHTASAGLILGLKYKIN